MIWGYVLKTQPSMRLKAYSLDKDFLLFSEGELKGILV
jgi:hypothetical protein